MSLVCVRLTLISRSIAFKVRTWCRVQEAGFGVECPQNVYELEGFGCLTVAALLGGSHPMVIYDERLSFRKPYLKVFREVQRGTERYVQRHTRGSIRLENIKA
jgi:hypothetical protein